MLNGFPEDFPGAYINPVESRAFRSLDFAGGVSLRFGFEFSLKPRIFFENACRFGLLM